MPIGRINAAPTLRRRSAVVLAMHIISSLLLLSYRHGSGHVRSSLLCLITIVPLWLVVVVCPCGGTGCPGRQQQQQRRHCHIVVVVVVINVMLVIVLLLSCCGGWPELVVVKYCR